MREGELVRVSGIEQACTQEKGMMEERERERERRRWADRETEVRGDRDNERDRGRAVGGVRQPVTFSLT